MKFEEALDDSESREGGRSVLLGNGFSIDWNHEIFHYKSLYEEAELSKLSVTKDELFKSLDSHDFEYVIHHLRTAAKISTLYLNDQSFAKTLRSDALVVRRGLSEVIARRHPGHSYEPSQDEVDCARKFLSSFGRIFTLNYDLLLYWVLNRDSGSAYSVQKGDGFEWPSYKGPKDLIWKISAAERGQRVYYLHGALHYFVRSDQRLHKLYYDGIPIVDQVREQIEQGDYPLLVTEGDKKEKLARIERSGYLRHCHRRLSKIEGSLFVHGASVAPNDMHIFSPLESKRSQVEALYVSLFGNPREEHNDQVVQAVNVIKKSRMKNGGKQLEVNFYDATSARVWR